MKKTTTALYCRISREDDTNDFSSSIKTQKEFLKQYAIRNSFTGLKYYVDDGFSGTNFERPAFQQLINEIEKGLISTVITKDLSRLGRNYLSTGYYIEHYFPSNHVRFIAINDNVDTSLKANDFTPFKNIINEWYARDIGQKIRSAYRTKAENGKFTGAVAPYGYSKDPQDKNHLIINEELARIIRLIFEMYYKRSTVYGISQRLKSEQVLTPRADTYSKTSKYRLEISQKYPYSWSPQTILSILSNQVYIGHVVCNRHRTKSFKDKTLVQVPEKDWIITKNVHEPIIDSKLFDDIQELLKLKPKRRAIRYKHLFKGKIRCSDCGNVMIYAVDKRRKDSSAYVCSTYRVHGRERCTSHFLRYKDAVEGVRTILLLLHKKIRDDKSKVVDALYAQVVERYEVPDDSEMFTDKCRYRLDMIKGLLKTLYEDFALKRIDQETFNELLSQFKQEQSVINEKIETHTETTLYMQEIKQYIIDIIEIIASYKSIKNLTYEMVDKLIDKVFITSKGNNRDAIERIELHIVKIGKIDLAASGI
jgi:DNA invertase Pin-like site-specific DNA recombinase